MLKGCKDMAGSKKYLGIMADLSRNAVMTMPAMKKFIDIALILVTVLALFTACGGKYTCDICKQEKTSGKNEFELEGEKCVYCSDEPCKSQGDAAKALAELAEQFG